MNFLYGHTSIALSAVGKFVHSKKQRLFRRFYYTDYKIIELYICRRKSSIQILIAYKYIGKRTETRFSECFRFLLIKTPCARPTI